MERQTRELRSFTVLAYLLTWVFLAPWFYLFNVVYHEEMPRWMWVLVPPAFIGGWGPSVAALIMTALNGGRMAVRQILGSLIIWRVSILWYLTVFLLPPLLTAGSLLIVDRGVATLGKFDLAAFLSNVPIAYALALPFGPLGEELGWRGFALPRLLSCYGPITASLVLGLLWTFWHIPMMIWSPGASMPSFMPLSIESVMIYFVQTVSITAMMTVLFLRTNGSVLLAILAHLAFNSAENILYGGLPDLSAEQLHSVYLTNVGLMALFGLISVGWLASSKISRQQSCAPTHQ